LDQKPLTPEEIKAADDNQDNIIDVSDIVHIMKRESSGNSQHDWKFLKSVFVLTIDMVFIF
jgi:hypothetical protein